MNTPISKINTKKWSGFIAHIRGEAEFMKSVRENASDERKSSNTFYSTLSQTTAKTIFASSRKKAHSSLQIVDSVPRIPRKQKVPELPKPKKNVIQLEANEENLTKWPKRKSAAERILNPDKLKDFPDMKREKDCDVVEGALYSDDLLLAI